MKMGDGRDIPVVSIFIVSTDSYLCQSQKMQKKVDKVVTEDKDDDAMKAS